jgi:CubicO group peptidase (beta-lactamase class C family)
MTQLVLLLCAFLSLQTVGYAVDVNKGNVREIVTQVIRPIMQRYDIPGMAVGVVADGHNYVYDFGIASRATAKPVDSSTLFEIGSVTKTFTATLISYARVTGKLSLSDEASTYVPSLRGTSFDRVSLLNLGTHTSGGLPLQFPEDVKSADQAISYYRNWKPTHTPGVFRTYSNPSIMLLGLIAAKSMHGDFITLMERKLFPQLGLKHTYLDVPEEQLGNYAQGYTSSNSPVRMSPGALAAEAYGVRTTAGDLLRFVDANMDIVNVGDTLKRAINESHTGYYRIGAMTQDLIWEQYRYPVRLTELLEGNSDQVMFDANPSAKLDPPSSPDDDVLIDKTGSTRGFGAYVAFVPAKKIGVVLLANKSLPIAVRVTAAHQILTRLSADTRFRKR